MASGGIAVLVTGTTALNIDVSNKLSSALPVMLVLIVVLALVLLMLVFRSLRYRSKPSPVSSSPSARHSAS